MEKLIICRCEEVSLEEIETIAKEYEGSAREIKLRTRAGMGYCGGRTCRTAVDTILLEIRGKLTENDIPLKVQPPVRPVTLSVLGGQAVHEE